MKEVTPVPVSQVIFPLAFKLVPVGPHVHSIPLRLALNPLANIRVLKSALPDPIPVFNAIQPLAIVYFAVCISENALATRSTVQVIPLVHTAS